MEGYLAITERTPDRNRHGSLAIFFFLFSLYDEIMKIERSEKEIRLIPESNFEKECLQLIFEKRGKIQFQDHEWKTGPLLIELIDDKW